MASSNIARRKNGKWRARYRDAEGREHARHFDRRVEAQTWLDQVTAAVVTGQYADPRAGRQTFGTYAEEWQRSHVTGPAGQRIVDNALRVHIVPASAIGPWHCYGARTCSRS